jgi:hypothetical protein
VTNAETTARRVLEWAAQPPDPAGGALPSGSLRSAAALAAPTAATITALAALVRRTGARIGTGSPAFGDRSPAGPGAILLAAAIGGRAQAAPARLLAEAVRPPRLGATGWADALARHAVLQPALSQLTPDDGSAESLVELLLRCSPLTAVLHRPPAVALAEGATANEVAAVTSLLTRPRGVDVLQATLSRFSADPAVLAWRTELLTRLGVDRPVFVLDTYLTARLRHGPEWDEALARARRAFSLVSGPDELCIATARYWLPLSRLCRSHPVLLRERPLMTGYQEALRLVEGRHRRSIAGAAA